jgi:hypothetical protein
MSMRLIIVALLLVFGLGGAARADGYGDPKALLNDIFQPYSQHQRPADPSVFYSDGLKALFAHHAQLSEISGVGMPPHPLAPADSDFDPFVNAQSYLLFDLNIGDPVVSGDHAMANVSYRNFDHPSQLSISMIKGPDGWKVDDVASLGADQHWLLSWLLAYDPLGVH